MAIHNVIQGHLFRKEWQSRDYILCDKNFGLISEDSKAIATRETE